MRPCGGPPVQAVATTAMKMYRLVAATVRAVCFGELEMTPLDFLVLMAVGELGEVECRGVVAWCAGKVAEDGAAGGQGSEALRDVCGERGGEEGDRGQVCKIKVKDAR